MKTTRRQLLGVGAAALTAGLLSGCESLEQRMTHEVLPANTFPLADLPNTSPALRLLNRAAYGPRPGDVARVSQLGLTAYVEQQLSPETLEEDSLLTWRLGSIADTLTPDPGLLFDENDGLLVDALRQSSILRAVYSSRQLQERMVEFWTDHFNIYAFKGQGPQLKVVDDHETIRKYALGRFRDLLGASARSAAMLGYLDNTANLKGIPNENYARELMELHTLGVHGGYSQRDVQEVARCLTGWTSEKHWHRGRFLFDDSAHDTGVKHVLGNTIPDHGAGDGERVLDILAAHPSTARHLATKLCRHFIGAASEQQVSSLSSVYRETDGDIKAMLRSLLTSANLADAPPILKRPYDYAVSALRVFNCDTDGGIGVQEHLARMGQPLFAWPMPDGFPDAAKAWTGTLIPRWNYALGLAGGTISNTTLDTATLIKAGQQAGLGPHDTLLELAFSCPAAHPSVSCLQVSDASSVPTREYAATLLMSPAFQWR
ncbi:MAG: DUF1800 domain-containing protein [Janthinobacterium lividum]